LVKLGDNGFFTVNGKQFGSCKTLHEVRWCISRLFF
jgi:hypothetical protein